jgi:hypothetical protein
MQSLAFAFQCWPCGLQFLLNAFELFPARSGSATNGLEFLPNNLEFEPRAVYGAGTTFSSAGRARVLAGPICAPAD